jgi:hypothetical protein
MNKQPWNQNVKLGRASMKIVAHWITISLSLATLLLGTCAMSIPMQAESRENLEKMILRNADAEKQIGVGSDVINEAPESSNPQERAARKAKNSRYNTGGKDITLLDPKLGSDEEKERFIDHYWLRDMPFFPTSDSAIVVLGTMVRVQPYLSEDRSNIYTELAIRVEEVFKSDATKPIALQDKLVVDRLGGALRLASGRIVRLDQPNQGPGKTRIGGRYVVFAKRTHNGNDLEMITGFELRAGKVFGLTSDGGVSFTSRRGVSKELVEEEQFLEAVRRSKH